jgi:hypothetical protein
MQTRKYWKTLLKGFPDLQFLSWLTLLPVYDNKGNAIKCCNPIVHFNPKDFDRLDKDLRKLGHKFIDSTVWYPDGQYFPRSHIARGIGYDL